MGPQLEHRSKTHRPSKVLRNEELHWLEVIRYASQTLWLKGYTRQGRNLPPVITPFLRKAKRVPKNCCHSAADTSYCSRGPFNISSAGA